MVQPPNSFFVHRFLFVDLEGSIWDFCVFLGKHPQDYTVPHWINLYTRHGLWGGLTKDYVFFFRTPDPIFLTLPLHFENHASFGTSPDWFPKCVGRSVGSGDAKSATGRIFWIQAEMFAWIVNLGEHHCKLHTMMFCSMRAGIDWHRDSWRKKYAMNESIYLLLTKNWGISIASYASSQDWVGSPQKQITGDGMCLYLPPFFHPGRAIFR